MSSKSTKAKMLINETHNIRDLGEERVKIHEL